LVAVNSTADSDVSETVHVGTGVAAHAESFSGYRSAPAYEDVTMPSDQRKGEGWMVWMPRHADVQWVRQIVGAVPFDPGTIERHLPAAGVLIVFPAVSGHLPLQVFRSGSNFVQERLDCGAEGLGLVSHDQVAGIRNDHRPP
jgi:hypothetical protein